MFNFGTYKLKANKQIELTEYNFIFESGVVIDLLSVETTDNIRCADYSIADLICTNPNYELAKLIINGDIEVIEKQEPSIVIE